MPARVSTEKKVMLAARRILSDQGVAALTMRAVAAAAGITPGAIYRHFPDKDALIARVVNEAFEKLQSGIWRVLARHPPGSVERIAEFGRMYIEFSRQQPQDYRLLFMPTEGPRRDPATSPIFDGLRIFQECVKDCIASGVFVEADPRMIALMMWARLHGLISLFLSFDLNKEYPELDRHRGLEQVATSTLPFILNGLRRR